MSSNSEIFFMAAAAAAAAAALYMLATTPEKPHSQQDTFMQALHDLDKIPKSVWDPLHTPIPGDWNWKYNYNRS